MRGQLVAAGFQPPARRHAGAEVWARFNYVAVFAAFSYLREAATGSRNADTGADRRANHRLDRLRHRLWPRRTWRHRARPMLAWQHPAAAAGRAAGAGHHCCRHAVRPAAGSSPTPCSSRRAGDFERRRFRRLWPALGVIVARTPVVSARHADHPRQRHPPAGWAARGLCADAGRRAAGAVSQCHPAAACGRG